MIQGAAITTTVTTAVTSTTVLTTCPTTLVDDTHPSTAQPPTSTGIGGTRTSTSTTPSGAPTDTNEAIQRGNSWIVPGVGTFRNRKTFTFSGNTLPAGLWASDYFVEDRAWSDKTSQIPFNHIFTPGNVQVSNGYLNLIVPGGQNPAPPTRRNPTGTPISCGEVVTTECNILGASVRTRAIFSKVPGTCHGLFFYKNDTQESDIEYLTDPASAANNGDLATIPIWYSNQGNEEGNEPTHESLDPPSDPSESVHEYRTDWTPNYTAYFFDGVEQARFTTDVPSQPGRWVWNNWANGDPNWSVGPPGQDSILRVQRIDMYYNTSNTGDQC